MPGLGPYAVRLSTRICSEPLGLAKLLVRSSERSERAWRMLETPVKRVPRFKLTLDSNSASRVLFTASISAEDGEPATAFAALI